MYKMTKKDCKKIYWIWCFVMIGLNHNFVWYKDV